MNYSNRKQVFVKLILSFFLICPIGAIKENAILQFEMSPFTAIALIARDALNIPIPSAEPVVEVQAFKIYIYNAPKIAPGTKYYLKLSQSLF